MGSYEEACLASLPASKTMERYGKILASFEVEEKRKLHALMESIEELFPSELRDDKWYLSAIGALVGSGQPSYTAELYQYLLEKPAYTSPEQRQALVRRLREALIKCIPINGIPFVMEAVRALAAVERLEDQDHSVSREGWQVSVANEAYAKDTLRKLYKGNEDEIYASFGSHKDIEWISNNISYGLFLADHRILDIRESELVILPAILCTNLAGPAYWHLRASVRIGFKTEEIEYLQQIAEMVAGYGGRSLVGLKRVADVDDA